MTENRRATLDLLISLGRSCGAISAGDLKRAAPIDTMTPEEVATLIAQLEKENVDVELDPALTARRGDAGRNGVAEAPLPPRLENSSAAAAGSIIDLEAARRRPSRTREARTVSGRWRVNFAIVLAAVCVLVLAWAFWRLT